MCCIHADVTTGAFVKVMTDTNNTWLMWILPVSLYDINNWGQLKMCHKERYLITESLGTKGDFDPYMADSWSVSVLMFYLLHVAVLSLSKKSAHNHSEELERNDQGKERRWKGGKKEDRAV